MDLFTHLQNHMQIANEVPDSEFKTFLGRVADYIGWIMHEQTLSQGQAIDTIFEQPTTFIRYLPVLKGKYSLKSGTVYNILLDLSRFAQYMTVYEQRDAQRALILFDQQRKIANKKKKKDIKARLTVENLEKEMKWPAGGKKELYELLLKSQRSVDGIYQLLIDGGIVANADIGFAGDWTASLLFVDNPQGRSRAITMMPFACLPTLKAQQLWTSADFKTQETFGYQTVMCNAKTFPYLEAYYQYIRPLRVQSGHCATFFVNTEGSTYQNVGVCLTRTFKAISPYHITSGALRSLFETEVAVGHETGLLTAGEVASATRNNQHSSATSHNFYLKRRACDEGRKAAMVHEKLYGKASGNNVDGVITSPGFHRASDPPYSPLPELLDNEDVEKDDDDDDDDEAFYMHRPKKSRRERNTWSLEELSHLRLWVRGYERSYGIDVFKNWKACCTAMDNTAEFHVAHLTPVALREAWRREQAKMAKSYVKM